MNFVAETVILDVANILSTIRNHLEADVSSKVGGLKATCETWGSKLAFSGTAWSLGWSSSLMVFNLGSPL